MDSEVLAMEQIYNCNLASHNILPIHWRRFIREEQQQLPTPPNAKITDSSIQTALHSSEQMALNTNIAGLSKKKETLEG